MRSSCRRPSGVSGVGSSEAPSRSRVRPLYRPTTILLSGRCAVASAGNARERDATGPCHIYTRNDSNVSIDRSKHLLRLCTSIDVLTEHLLTQAAIQLSAHSMRLTSHPSGSASAPSCASRARSWRRVDRHNGLLWQSCSPAARGPTTTVSSGPSASTAVVVEAGCNHLAPADRAR